MTERRYHHGNLKNCLIEAGIELVNTEGENIFLFEEPNKVAQIIKIDIFLNTNTLADIKRVVQRCFLTDRIGKFSYGIQRP